MMVRMENMKHLNYLLFIVMVAVITLVILCAPSRNMIENSSFKAASTVNINDITINNIMNKNEAVPKKTLKEPIEVSRKVKSYKLAVGEEVLKKLGKASRKEKSDKLTVGGKVPSLALSGENDAYRLDSWPNRLVIVSYIDPRFANQGDATVKALKKAVKDSSLSLNIYQPVAIINSSATWKPKKLVKAVAKRRTAREKVLSPLLFFDDEGVINKKMKDGNSKNSSCFIVIGKDGVVDAIFRGKLSDAQNEELITLAEKIQDEPNVEE